MKNKTNVSSGTKKRLTIEIEALEKEVKEIEECAESQKTNGGHFWYMGKIRSPYLIIQLKHELEIKKKLREKLNNNN